MIRRGRSAHGLSVERNGCRPRATSGVEARDVPGVAGWKRRVCPLAWSSVVFALPLYL